MDASIWRIGYSVFFACAHLWHSYCCLQRALLIGCCYPGSSAALNGCINDVQVRSCSCCCCRCRMSCPFLDSLYHMLLAVLVSLHQMSDQPY